MFASLDYWYLNWTVVRFSNLWQAWTKHCGCLVLWYHFLNHQTCQTSRYHRTVKDPWRSLLYAGLSFHEAKLHYWLTLHIYQSRFFSSSKAYIYWTYCFCKSHHLVYKKYTPTGITLKYVKELLSKINISHLVLLDLLLFKFHLLTFLLKLLVPQLAHLQF